MARGTESAAAGSTQLPLRTRIAAATAGGALALTGVLATSTAAEATDIGTSEAPVPEAGPHRDAGHEEPEALVVGLIVEYEGTQSRVATAAQAARSLGQPANVGSVEDGAGVVSFTEPTDLASAEKIRKRVERLPGVLSAQLNVLHRPMAEPPVSQSDPLFPDQHGLWDTLETVGYRVNGTGEQYVQEFPAGGYGTRAPALWRLTQGSSKITVAVIDTGSTPHPDLDDNTVAGWDMISGEFDPRDGDGRDDDPTDEGDWYGAWECGDNSDASPSSWHGTHVAGIIAAAANGVGVVGNAPGVKVQHVRVLGKCGGTTEDIADAITWASGGKVAGTKKNKTPAKILNLSLGAPIACQQVMQKAINGARKRGAVVIVAAGNSNKPAENYQPGNCKNVITVAATNRVGARASYSNFGKAVDIAAAGGSYYDFGEDYMQAIVSSVNQGSTTPTGPGVNWYQGTSMAAPNVAGVAALIASLRPKITPAQLERALLASVQKFPKLPQWGRQNCAAQKDCGKGIVDAGRAATAFYVKPAISDAVVGKTATVKAKVVAPKAKLSYQWYRSGKAIKGATTSSYKVKKGDLGKKLTVKVTAKLSGFPSKSLTSKAVKVAKLTPSVSVKLAKTTIKKSKRGKLTITVKARPLTKKPTGTLTVTYGTKSKSYTLKASKKGTRTVTLPKLPKGTHKIKVKYTPSKTYKKYVKAKTSKTIKLKVT